MSADDGFVIITKKEALSHDDSATIEKGIRHLQTTAGRLETLAESLVEDQTITASPGTPLEKVQQLTNFASEVAAIGIYAVSYLVRK